MQLIILYKGAFMDINTEQKMDMFFKKIGFYVTYVDCLSRLIRELIENGDDNFKPTDLPNLSVLLEKMSFRLKFLISKMASDWEFNK